MTRSAMARLYQMDARIRAGTYPNARSLAGELEVSPRTVRRYIELLRDRLGAPLAYHPRRRGYYYTTERFALPALLPLTPNEIAGLHVAAHLMNLVAGSALEQPVRQLLDKLAATLPEGISVGPQTPADLSFGLPTLRGNEALVATDLNLLQEAQATRRSVEVHYYSAYRDAWRRRRIDPYHLHYKEGAWYVIGWCHWRRRIRTFAVDRMRDLRLLTLGFQMQSGFDAQQYLRSAWQIEAGAPVTVTIWFASAQARYVRERQWHHTQELQEQPDGSLTLRAQVAGLSEIARWVLQFGSGAAVLAPPALRELVIQEVVGLTQRYGL